MRLVFIFIFLALGGCAASGVKITEEQANSFQVGQSTYADVVAALGEPTTTTMSSDGGRMAVYSYAAIQSRPQNFIPYIGPLIAGYDSQSSAVLFMFGPDGKLIRTTSTNSQMGSGANLAAGAPTPNPSVTQPR